MGGAERIRIQQEEVEGIPTPPDSTEDKTGEGLESDREAKKPRTQEPQPSRKVKPNKPRNFLEVLMENREKKVIRKQETGTNSNT